MEKEHLIIIAILGVILYMCMNKSEGFSYRNDPQNCGPDGCEARIRTRQIGGPCGEKGCDDPPPTAYIRYEKPGGPGLRIHSNMNIMGSQHIKSHIRNDRRNNMMSSMMYGYQNGDPQDCGPDGCA